jgi:hypothetical protein
MRFRRSSASSSGFKVASTAGGFRSDVIAAQLMMARVETVGRTGMSRDEQRLITVMQKRVRSPRVAQARTHDKCFAAAGTIRERMHGVNTIEQILQV